MLAAGAECVFGKGIGFVSRMFPVVILAVVGIVCTMTNAQEANSDKVGLAALPGLAQSNSNFTNDIYEYLSTKEGNVFYSPISIFSILGLLYLGAGGETASQLARGLYLPQDNEKIAAGFRALEPFLKSDENITLEIANKIYTETSIPLKQGFQDIARTSFQSEVESLNFKTNTEAARVQINEWVKGKTNNKIPELISNGDLTADTVLVLANAIYFKGEWATKFDPSNTRTAQFFLTPTQTKDVQLMSIRGKKFGYARNNELGCQVLQIPYKGKKLTMIIILPNELDGLPSLESTLLTADVSQLIGSIVQTQVDISIPKFKLEETSDLEAALTKLGMVDMFGSGSNFTGLTDTPVSVSKIVHKAFLEVNEEGAEAAAATGLGISATSLPPSFVANHPFLFAIFDTHLRTPILGGRFVGPEN